MRTRTYLESELLSIQKAIDSYGLEVVGALDVKHIIEQALEQLDEDDFERVRMPEHEKDHA
jgi:hypothetical protein